MTTRHFLAIVLLLLSALTSVFSQKVVNTSNIPEVGKPLPDFRLNYITHFKTKEATPRDFQGKWLFLDFWFTGCAACIHSFPKVNEFYREFGTKLNWIMIGLRNSEYKNTQELYEKFREKRNLGMPSAYDSVLFDKWGIHSMPHIIVVDPSGVVRYITNGEDITIEKIKDLLQGKSVSLYQKQTVRPKFNPSTLQGSTSESAKDNLIYRSLLSRWAGEKQEIWNLDEWIRYTEYHKDGLTLSMAPLYLLYNYAYLGDSDWTFENERLFDQYATRPMLEINDTSLFQYDFKHQTAKGLYTYHVNLPATDISKENIMSAMQKDLKVVFKYNVSIETREIPVWKLTAEPGTIDRLKSKGGEKFFTPGTNIAGYKIVNWPARYLIGSIIFYLKERYRGDIFVDATGIAGNIDFKIEADMTDINDVKRNLKKQGLDLVRSTHSLKVIVLRDPH